MGNRLDSDTELTSLLSRFAAARSLPGHKAELVLFFVFEKQPTDLSVRSEHQTSSSAICRLYLSDIIQLKTFQAGLNNILNVVLITKIFTDRILQSKFSAPKRGKYIFDFNFAFNIQQDWTTLLSCH